MANPNYRNYAEMKALRESGATLQQIGDKFGVSRQWVSKIVDGVVRQKKQKVSKPKEKRGRKTNITPKEFDAQWFWNQVDKPDVHACWMWKAGKTAGGYGEYRFLKKVEYAHIAAYKLIYGEVPSGYHVRHLCNNQLCCNPLHLSAGTAKENGADKIKHNNEEAVFSMMLDIALNPIHIGNGL